MAVAVVLCLGAATGVDAADQTGQATNGAGLDEAATRRIPAGSFGRNETMPTADARRLFDEMCLIGTLFACPGEAGAAAAKRVVPTQTVDQLRKLSLEELLQIRLPAVNPMGIGHIHRSREWMVGYQFMSMRMQGNREGTTRLTENQVLARYPVTPTSMDMDMHMFMVMYGASDRLTLTAMVPFHRRSMEHRTRAGTRFTTRSGGIGDVQVGGLQSLLARGSHEAHAFLLLDAPTGSIREEDVTPAGRVRLPYPMQPGSGTWNLAPGVTYLGARDSWFWGSQASGTIHLGENDLGYALGDSVRLRGWLTRVLKDWASLTVLFDAQAWGDISGADAALVPAMVPTADPALRAGRRLDASLGVNFFAPRGLLEGSRLSLLAGLPLHQRLDGPQLETDLFLSLQWRWTLGGE